MSMEDVLWTIVHVQVPHLDEAIRIVWSRWVLGVGCKDKLGKLFIVSSELCLA